MKTIKFRPLRRINKTGKICVASYSQWRKIKASDYESFILVINKEYESFDKSELVFDKNGENLFWKDFNPENITHLPSHILISENYPKHWRYLDFFSAIGLDCDGVPTFSHGTMHNLTIGNSYEYTLQEVNQILEPMNEYELLTVGVVVKWLGWFLFQLKNAELIFK